MESLLSDVTMVNGHALDGDASRRRASSHRKSGRVVKKPDLFQPPSPHARRKRKRTQASGNVDGEDASSSELEAGEENDESQSDADETSADETSQKRRRTNAARAQQSSRKQPRGKRPPSSSKPKANNLAFRARGKTSDGPLDPRSAEEFFSQVFNSRVDSDGIVSSWLARYEENPVRAMRDLVNVVLRMTGCTFEITEDDIEDTDNVPQKLNELQDEYHDQKIFDYPLIAKAKGAASARTRIERFFTSLIDGLDSSDMLYDDSVLLENIETWVTTMSSSSIRPFRHTATFICLTLQSALCTVAGRISETKSKITRQLQTEKKGKGNKSRINALQEKVNESERKRTQLETYIKNLFDAVFVHRYRDVDPRIRADCIHALGYWISSLPEIFFEGTYLRYLGWVLCDTAPPTRVEAVAQLQRLFAENENVAGLRSFTERFKTRLVEMATRDAEMNVRIQTIDLLESIREAGLLEPVDADNVGRLIFDSDARLRRAVAPFFMQNVEDLYETKVEVLGGEDEIEESLPKDDDNDYDKPHLSWLKLKCLVETLQAYDTTGDEVVNAGPQGSAVFNDMLIAAGVESRFSLAAQTLYESLPEINQWRILAGYLLFDHSGVNTTSRGRKQSERPEVILKRECKLDEKQEVVLLNILNAAVILSLSQGNSTDTHSKAKRKKKPLRTSLSDMQEDLARHLSQLIPRLLNKFGAAPSTASAVLRLEHALDLDVFHQLRQDSTNYASLLDNINKQFLTHADQAVLGEASAALLHARGFEDLEDVTAERVQSLWDDTVDTIQSLLHGRKLQKRGDMSPNSIVSLANTVRRVSNLASISDCAEVFDSAESSSKKASKSHEQRSTPLLLLRAVLRRGAVAADKNLQQPVSDKEDELLSCTIKSILFYFMWKVRTLQENLTAGDKILDFVVDDLKETHEDFSSALFNVMDNKSLGEENRAAAAGAFLDLFTLFSTLRWPDSSTTDEEANPGNNARARSLVSEVTPERVRIVTQVFVACEIALAKTSKLTLEAGEDDEPLDDDDEPESDDEGDGDEDNSDEIDGKRTAILTAEQRLCELTGKIVLAIIAQVIDVAGASAGSLRKRVQQNRDKLGPNFRQVVAHLSAPQKGKGQRGQKGPGRAVSASKAPDTQAQSKSGPQKSSEPAADDEEDEVEDVEEVSAQDEEEVNGDLRDDQDDIEDDDDNANDVPGDEQDDIIIGD